MSRIRKVLLSGVAAAAVAALMLGGTSLAANATEDVPTTEPTSTSITSDPTPTQALEPTAAAPAEATTNTQQQETGDAGAASTDQAEGASSTSSDTSSVSAPAVATDPISTPSTPASSGADAESGDSTATEGTVPQAIVAPVTSQSQDASAKVEYQPTVTVTSRSANVATPGHALITINYQLTNEDTPGELYFAFFHGATPSDGGFIDDVHMYITKSGPQQYTVDRTLIPGDYSLRIQGKYGADCQGRECYGQVKLAEDLSFTVKAAPVCTDPTIVDITSLIKRGADYNTAVIPTTDVVRFINDTTGEVLQAGTVLVPEGGLVISGVATRDCVKVIGKVTLDYAQLTKVEYSQTSTTDCVSKQVTVTSFETFYTRTSPDVPWVEESTKQTGTDTRAATDDELKAAACAVAPAPSPTPSETTTPTASPAPVAQPSAPTAGKSLAATGVNGAQLGSLGFLAVVLLAGGGVILIVRRSQRRREGMNSES